MIAFLINFFSLLVIGYAVVGIGEMMAWMCGIDQEKEMECMQKKYNEFKGSAAEWIRG